MGDTILVTRPVHQADSLCTLIEAAGAKTIRLPTIAIQPVAINPMLKQQLQEQGAYDLIIFISANAVDQFFASLSNWSPVNLNIAAIGKATRSALERHGAHVDIMPLPPYNSEALLADENLQSIRDQRILIVKGHGGRDFLADTLAQRGARVVEAIVYQRSLPDVDVEPVINALSRGDISAVIITSKENLQNLLKLLDPARDSLCSIPVIAISANVAHAVEQAGFHADIIVATEASDQGLLEALHRLHSKH